MSGSRDLLAEIFHRLDQRFGPQHWWPGETPFEVMVGAILTQNTNWANVERAIANLKEAGALSPEGMSALSPEELAGLIRPSGYYNIKAGRLRNLLELIQGRWGGDLAGLLAQPAAALREQLLSVKGIGPETADSIILYAAGQPVFVVDAYTHRILFRHGLVPEECGYDEMQELFHQGLEPDPALFNQYHALIVRVGKEFCSPRKPRCENCPLAGVGQVTIP